MELIWDGPLTFRELISDQKLMLRFKMGGVYLWTECLGDNQKILYIGKATAKTTLWERNFLHYMHLIGGLWNIPKDFPGKGYKEWIPTLDPKRNKDYEKMREIIIDRDKFKEHVNRAFEYLEHLKIYFCPLDKLSSNEIANVERNLLFKFKPSGTKLGTLTRPEKLLVVNIPANIQI